MSLKGIEGKRIAIVVAIFMLLALAAVIIFIIMWHRRGDAFAQAAGQLLTFAAAVLATLATLAYLYYTHLGLKEAQRANRLQERQWLQRVAVKPKFWLAKRGFAHYKFPEQANLMLGRYEAFDLVVWNFSEQSFLVHSVEMGIYRSKSGHSERFSRVVEVNKVVPPHQTITVDISNELLETITGGMISRPSLLVSNLPSGQFSLTTDLRYTDWQKENEQSHILVNSLFAELVSGNPSMGVTQHIAISVVRDSGEGL